jgi:catechol 2,3-dioxygenase-like lactoylglutathione lyase family enzyme
MPDDNLVHVRHMVDDVQAAVDFYTTHLGFTLRSTAAPAFADVVRGNRGLGRHPRLPGRRSRNARVTARGDHREPLPLQTHPAPADLRR